MLMTRQFPFFILIKQLIAFARDDLTFAFANLRDSPCFTKQEAVGRAAYLTIETFRVACTP